MGSGDAHDWRLIRRYDVLVYACGLRAGEQVRLIKPLTVQDHLGTPVYTHLAGPLWTVLAGAAEDPGIVWLRQPDGERHTWDDDPAIFEWFARA